jgi:hypothetical protein
LPETPANKTSVTIKEKPQQLRFFFYMARKIEDWFSTITSASGII